MVSIKLHKPIVKGTLTLENGERVEVERIGRGRFTTAWKNCTSVYLQTKEEDNGKEMYSNMPDNPHLPKVEKIGYFNTSYLLYRSPLYRPLTSKDKRAWSDFKVLQTIWDEAWKVSRVYNVPLSRQVFDFRENFRKMILDATYLSQSLKDAIEQLLDASANYGDTWTIEVVKRNSAVSELGDLILLDYIFDLQIIRDQQEKAQKKYRGY